jgi:serine/threonine protein phosphatase PrpC
VTCFPDIEVHERTPHDDLLIIGCDGVWDVLSSEEGVGVVREIFESGETSMLKAAEELIDVALAKG